MLKNANFVIKKNEKCELLENFDNKIGICMNNNKQTIFCIVCLNIIQKEEYIIEHFYDKRGCEKKNPKKKGKFEKLIKIFIRKK